MNEKFIHANNYKIIQHFLQNKVNILTLKQLMDIFKYHSNHVGVNHHNEVEGVICDFEIFLVGVSNGYYEDITLKDVLFFVASVHKIPLFRLEKKIDIRFNKDVSLSPTSTCSWNLTLTFRDIVNKIVLALKIV